MDGAIPSDGKIRRKENEILKKKLEKMWTAKAKVVFSGYKIDR